MKATTILEREHEVILRTLNLLEAAATMARSGIRPPNGFYAWAMRFIRDFADGLHHAKEEEALFPMLEERGIPRENGPIGWMLREHELGRECVRRMNMALANAADDPAAFARAASDYIGLLRQHIFKENNVLFVMARRCMTPADDARTVEKYKATDTRAGDARARFETELAGFEQQFAEMCEPAGITSDGPGPA
jgi:hemerythrin-like domain-containing protein